MTTSKKGISALELQRLLGAPYYQRVHHMKQRIQEAMEARESLYQLNTFVEVDEAFFGGSRTGVKGGRGSNHLTTVQVSVAVGENDRPTYAKMKVIPDTTATTLTNTVLEHIEPGSIVVTDGWQGYNRLEEYGYTHLPCSTPTPKEAQLYLPWVHILISNAKRFILGTHHAVQPQNLQRYLNEFCYRFNRRFFNNNLFQRALYAATLFKPDYLTEPII
jgi:transposase-like protein